MQEEIEWFLITSEEMEKIHEQFNILREEGSENDQCFDTLDRVLDTIKQRLQR
jgi:hypothetical protein